MPVSGLLLIRRRSPVTSATPSTTSNSMSPSVVAVIFTSKLGVEGEIITALLILRGGSPSGCFVLVPIEGLFC